MGGRGISQLPTATRDTIADAPASRMRRIVPDRPRRLDCTLPVRGTCCCVPGFHRGASRSRPLDGKPELARQLIESARKLRRAHPVTPRSRRANRAFVGVAQVVNVSVRRQAKHIEDQLCRHKRPYRHATELPKAFRQPMQPDPCHRYL